MIVWTNGCFDCIHAGHVEILDYARKKGHKLIVGIDSDDRVKKSKGANRPIHSQDSRKRVLESIKHVDEVVIFSSDEELVECIKKSCASLIVVGSDYIDKKVIGSELVEVNFFKRIPEFSSTKIIERGGLNE